MSSPCSSWGACPCGQAERREGDPVVIAGGPCVFNPLPMAPFFDAIVIGEGEEVISEIADVLLQAKQKGLRREGVLERLSGIAGLFVPSVFREGTKIRKRIIADLDRWLLPRKARRAADEHDPRPHHPRDRPGLHAGVPVLPGGDGLAAREGAQPLDASHHGRSGPQGHGVRRDHASVSELRRLLADRAAPEGADGPVQRAPGRPGAPVASRGDPEPGAHRADPQGPQDELYHCPRGRDPAPAGRSSTRETPRRI